MAEPIELRVGDIAPDFNVEDAEGNMISLSNLNSSGKTVIIYFYPKDNTPGCTAQACDFRDGSDWLESTNHVVLGISKDSVKSHKKFIDKYGLNFPLLLDEDLAIHTQYGVWKMKKNYGRSYMGTVRSTFVINPDGRLSWVGYNVRAKGHFDKLVTELELE